MEIACAPDMFQSIMMDVLGDLDYVIAYKYNVICMQKEVKLEDDHLEKLETVMRRLEEAGFCANLRKIFFMQKGSQVIGLLAHKGWVESPTEEVRIHPPNFNPKEFKTTEEIHWNDQFLSRHLGEAKSHTRTTN